MDNGLLYDMELILSDIGNSKDNVKSPIHNWYKFTAGFSYKFVELILSEKPKDSVVFEPFAGCGTTLVSSQKKGVKAVGNEGQAFMYDVCRAKIGWDIEKYDILRHMDLMCQQVEHSADRYDVSRENTLLRELYPTQNLRVLCTIRDYVNDIQDEKSRLFFMLALSSVLHKTSIYPIAVPYITRKKELVNNGQPLEKFVSVCNQMLQDVSIQPHPYVHSEIYLHDSRYINDHIPTGSCTLSITSPPYLNNLDYGEVSKVHTHFWGITNNWNDITTKVRANLVTGATTHYRDSEFNIDDFMKTEFAIKNSAIMPELVSRYKAIKENANERNGKKSFHILMMLYFEDMYKVLREMRRVLAPNSEAYLILGDSAPYGVYIPTTNFLGEIAISAGFAEYRIYKIRSRGIKWKTLTNRHNIELAENILLLRG